MARLTRWSTPRWLLAALLVFTLLASACSGASDRPAPGQYDVQKGSVHYDGDRYQLFWANKDGSLHRLETRNLKLVQDPERTYLDVPGSGDPILHLRQDEPITVDGQDHQGSFTSFWFPFWLGSTLGGIGRGPVVINQPAPGQPTYGSTTPTYRYPPTDTFGRGDELRGTLDSSKAQMPDYTKVQPAPWATTGQTSGTGGGTAATNKSAGGVSQPDAIAPNTGATSGQSAGTGSGTAASSKGGFSSGSQSFGSKSGGASVGGAGSRGILGGSSGSSSGSSSSGGKGIGDTKAPSGGKGIGGAKAPSGRR